MVGKENFPTRRKGQRAPGPGFADNFPRGTKSAPFPAPGTASLPSAKAVRPSETAMIALPGGGARALPAPRAASQPERTVQRDRTCKSGGVAQRVTGSSARQRYPRLENECNGAGIPPKSTEMDVSPRPKPSAEPSSVFDFSAPALLLTDGTTPGPRSRTIPDSTHLDHGSV